MKKILFLGLGLLLLVSCGKEHIEVKKDPKYIYVEIEECTIPVPEIYDIMPNGSNQPYSHKYIDKNNTINSAIVAVPRHNHDFEKIQEITKVASKYLNLKTSIYQKNNFKIFEVKSLSPFNINYHLFGFKTTIVMNNSSDAELNYLLQYCQKTWKLDKKKGK